MMIIIINYNTWQHSGVLRQVWEQQNACKIGKSYKKHPTYLLIQNKVGNNRFVYMRSSLILSLFEFDFSIFHESFGIFNQHTVTI